MRGIFTLVTDVTDRKKVEDSLRRSEERLRLVTDSVPAFISYLDSEQRFQFVNRHYEKTFGRKQEEFIGRHVREILGDDRYPIYKPHLEKVLAGNHVNFETRITLKGQEEEMRSLNVEYSPDFSESGEVIGCFVLRTDITARYQAESKIRQREELLRATLESTLGGILVVDSNGKLTHSNTRFAEMWSFPEAILSAGDFEVLVEFAASQLVDPEAFVLRINQLYDTTDVRSDTLRLKDGRVFERRSCPLIRDGIVDGRVWNFYYITEQVRLEEQARRHHDELAHVSRIGTMGEMATSIAHELNQPLAAVANFAFVIENELSNHSGTEKNAEFVASLARKVKTQVIRAGDIVRRMREFLRNVESHKVSSDINEVVSLVEPEARQRRVSVQLKLDNDIPKCRLDNIRIQQVVVNLIRNAFDAMSENDVNNRNVIVATTHNDDRFVEVSVQDRGHGIQFADIDSIFNTFFTTKQTEMGMCLAISRSFIEEHGGVQWVDPDVRDGALFKFQLPVEPEGNDFNR